MVKNFEFFLSNFMFKIMFLILQLPTNNNIKYNILTKFSENSSNWLRKSIGSLQIRKNKLRNFGNYYFRIVNLTVFRACETYYDKSFKILAKMLF